MKNRKFIKYLLVFALICSSSFAVTAQTGIGFKSGIRISTKTEAVFGDSQRIPIRPLDKWETINGKDILHRRLIDTKNSLFFGYDVEVERNAESNKFNVSIKPLSYVPGSNPDAQKYELGKYSSVPLPKYSGETVVENGDIIKLDLLENPEKKIKITDYLKISDKTKPFAISFSELQPTRDFTVDDINLKLIDFQIFINKKLVGKMDGGGIAPNIYFTVPNRGRFIISAFPRKGYNLQKIGNVVDNKLTFTIGGDKYEVVSNFAILGDGGNWNVWILADPDFEKFSGRNSESIEVGAGNIDFFFKKPNLNNR